MQALNLSLIVGPTALTQCARLCQVSSRFADLRGAVGSIFIEEADLKHVRQPLTT